MKPQTVLSLDSLGGEVIIPIAIPTPNQKNQISGGYFNYIAGTPNPEIQTMLAGYTAFAKSENPKLRLFGNPTFNKSRNPNLLLVRSYARMA